MGAAIFSNPFFGFCGCSIVNANRMTCDCQMPGHWIPHNAKANKRDFDTVHVNNSLQATVTITQLAAGSNRNRGS